MLHRVQVTDISTLTVQRRLLESGLHRQIAAKKQLLKDINNKKRLAWAKKDEQWTLDLWKFVLGSGVQIGDFWLQLPCVGERMISACVFPTIKHKGGVVVWGYFAGDTVYDLFRIQGTLKQHGYHSILQQYAIPSGSGLVGL